jgi:dCMP deaminase
VVVKDGVVIARKHNHHVPSEHMPYVNGDPRDVIKSGTLNLVYSSLHAEQTIIAESARDGVSLKGTDIYLNDFPCPLCAKLMASAGIKRCFFKAGSTWLDAESVLHAAGVEIVLVK